jgi:hypothetical protein
LDGLIKAFVVETGKMAKACEALDHLEKYDYRAVLEESTVKLTGEILNFAAGQRIDLRTAVEARWREVEQRSIFLDGNRQGERSPKLQVSGQSSKRQV